MRMDHQTDLELPRGIALAWGVAANPQRGPRRELTIEQIVETAVRIADQGGLSAVSMSSVASALGFTPMSLYRYVSAKDDLLLLMQEEGIGLPPESIREASTPRDALVDYAKGMLEIYTEHPWLLEIPVEGPPQTPHNIAWLDAALGALAPVRLGYGEKLAIVLAIVAHVRWNATILRGYTTLAGTTGRTSEDVDATIAARLTELVSREEFPYAADSLLSGAFQAQTDPFAFGLDRLLDGVMAYIEAHPTGSDPTELPAAPDPLDAVAAKDERYREAVKQRREAEKKLRDARKKERERFRDAREKAGKQRVS